MAALDYTKLQQRVSGVMTKVKQGTVVLTRTTYTPNVTEPWNSTTSTVNYTLDAAVSSVGKEFIDGTNILATDKMVTCAVPAIEIEPGDTLAIDGVTVTILKTIRIPAAGTAVAWNFIVRG